MLETISYTIGQLAIQIPVDHPLPRFQESLQLYERFPFFLAPACEKDEWIIDAGANIGDTTVALIQATQGSVLALEASDVHFGLLQENVMGLSAHLRSRIRMVKTASHNGIDKLLAFNDIPEHAVAVLKMSAGLEQRHVLSSAASLLKTGSPILYFKNQFANEALLKRDESFYAALEQTGYGTFWIFDNFGNPLLDRASAACLPSLADYLRAGLSGRSLHTISYYDILACKDDRVSLVNDVVSNFRAFVNLDEEATAAAFCYTP